MTSNPNLSSQAVQWSGNNLKVLDQRRLTDEEYEDAAGVKVMVAAPSSAFDFSLESGDGIEIEERNPKELLADCYLTEGSLVDAWNPVFDAPPAEPTSAIITERGAFIDPGKQGVRSLQAC